MTTSIKVWAEAGDVPGNVCADARLREEDGETVAKGDTYRGQAGWDVGIRYGNSFQALAIKLALDVVTKNGKITRLAIHAHGEPGKVYVNGTGQKALMASGSPEYDQAIALLNMALAPDAVILFVGCLAGQGEAGEQFLMEMSKKLPGRKVVAFQTIGYAPGGAYQSRNGESCTEPGMRATDAMGASADSSVKTNRANVWDSIWYDRAQLPWADEFAPTAVVARGGFLIGRNPLNPSRVQARQETIAAIPRKPVVKKKQPKDQQPLPMMVELTEDELLVYARVHPVFPKTVDQLTMETGLDRFAAEQAVRGLSRKMQIFWAKNGEGVGYVRFLNRYVP